MITQNPLGLPSGQNIKIWMARALVGVQPTPAHSGGYLRTERRPGSIT